MRRIFQVRTVVLCLGDVLVFSGTLWLSMLIRVGDFPDFVRHADAFGLLIAVWTLCFIIAGLYENRLLVYERAHALRLATTHTVNILLASLFFYLLPSFGITPKTILFIYLIVSMAFIFLWRLVVFPILFGLPQQSALIVGRAPELAEVKCELVRTGHFAVEHVCELPPSSSHKAIEEVERQIAVRRPDFVIIDIDDPTITAALPALRKLLLSGVSFISTAHAYEDIFGRVSLASMSDQWVVSNLSQRNSYDGLKRALDIVVGGIGLACSLPAYPIVALAIRLESPGPALIAQERVGQYKKSITVHKFRSMEVAASEDNPTRRITRVGAILRKSRIDELPQLLNVVRGDLSLIGPRPELPALVVTYENAISNYSLRHLLKPGLSGWAQLYHDNHPHHVADIQATKEKLSYDFYYMKHRSFVIDVLIALKTIRKVVLQSGK